MYLTIQKTLTVDFYDGNENLLDIKEKLEKNETLSDDDISNLRNVLEKMLAEQEIVILETDIEDLKWRTI